jgi:hypothetical protein
MMTLTLSLMSGSRRSYLCYFLDAAGLCFMPDDQPGPKLNAVRDDKPLGSLNLFLWIVSANYRLKANKAPVVVQNVSSVIRHCHQT